MAEQDKTYVPGYWRAAKNARTKKEKSSKPEKIKTVTVTKEGPLTKQQFGKITLNSIRLARNLSALPTIAKEVKQLSKNLKALSETKNFSKGKGKGVDVTKFLKDNASTIASVATLGAYAASDAIAETTPDKIGEEKPQEYKQSVYETKSLEADMPSAPSASGSRSPADTTLTFLIFGYSLVLYLSSRDWKLSTRSEPTTIVT